MNCDILCKNLRKMSLGESDMYWHCSWHLVTLVTTCGDQRETQRATPWWSTSSLPMSCEVSERGENWVIVIIISWDNARSERVWQCSVIMSSVHFINKCQPLPAHIPSYHHVTVSLTPENKELIIIIWGQSLNIIRECSANNNIAGVREETRWHSTFQHNRQTISEIRRRLRCELRDIPDTLGSKY